jgi:hypothetical protein
MAISPAALALFPALLGCGALLALPGCERRISPENIDSANRLQESAQQRKPKWTGVNEGMTEKEVESILGQPETRRAGKSVEINQPVEIPTVTYVYRQDGQAIELSFLDGKLQGHVPKFGETIDPKAPLHMLKKAAERRAAGEAEKPEKPAAPKPAGETAPTAPEKAPATGGEPPSK